jgi:cytochrome b561/polyisoprenoid-binding protein YceI
MRYPALTLYKQIVHIMISNTTNSYGSLARFFHWSIALLILTDIALGLIGDATERNAETAGFLQTLYSAHKTIGVTVLALALLRVIWALTQPKPAPLHPDRKAETFVAEVVHWALYGAIFVMPLSGWVIHSAETGFAPIWWPFGQDLPFVPKSEAVAHVAGAIHGLSAIVIYLTVGAHIAGALKHAIIDRDETIARMTRGTAAGASASKGGHFAPLIPAVALWAAIIAMPILTQPATEHPQETAAIASSSDANWTVDSGTLSFTVTQMGAPVVGQFGAWTASIQYDDAGTGQVEVIIDATSLTLGSVTAQAKGAEFFDTSNHATAVFAAQIEQIDGTSHRANGTLTLVGQTVPVVLDFTLDRDGDAATMTGTATLDRRDFGMGSGYSDESTVGFGVTVDVTLAATRTN